MITKPKARTESLIVREVEDETLVYDRTNDKAHCLNPTAAFVWKHCDGKTTVPGLARRMRTELEIPADDETVWLALQGLQKSKLLEEVPERPADLGMISRRDLAKRFGLAGAAAVALPAVVSIIAPRAAEAVSCVNPGGFAPFTCCQTNGDCCSGICGKTGDPNQTHPCPSPCIQQTSSKCCK